MDSKSGSTNWLIPVAGLLAVTFTICTSELVIAGLLPTLASDLQVDIPTAGMLITGYALGVAFAGPLLSLATTRVPRKLLLLAILAVFIVGNILCAISTGYWMLLAARLTMAACHGLFFGLAVVIATQLAPEGRKSAAVSMVFAGVTIAIIVGVPLGTAIGNAFGWRTTFWFTSVAGGVGALVVALLIPAGLGQPDGAGPGLAAQLRAAVRPVVLLCYAIFGLGCVAFFALLSYVVPFLTLSGGLALEVIPLVLFGTGIASFLGTLIGGRLGDWNPSATLIGASFINTALFVVLSQVAQNGWLAAALLCLIWMIGFTVPPALQSRVLKEASDAPNLAATLMNTASQFGIAGGAALGAAVITQGLGYGQIPLVAAAIYVLSGVGCVVLVAYDRRRRAVPA